MKPISGSRKFLVGLAAVSLASVAAAAPGTLEYHQRSYYPQGCVLNGSTAVCTFVMVNRGPAATLLAFGGYYASELAGIQFVDNGNVPHNASGGYFIDGFGGRQQNLVLATNAQGTFAVEFANVNSRVTSGSFKLGNAMVGSYAVVQLPPAPPQATHAPQPGSPAPNMSPPAAVAAPAPAAATQPPGAKPPVVLAQPAPAMPAAAVVQPVRPAAVPSPAPTAAPAPAPTPTAVATAAPGECAGTKLDIANCKTNKKLDAVDKTATTVGTTVETGKKLFEMFKSMKEAVLPTAAPAAVQTQAAAPLQQQVVLQAQPPVQQQLPVQQVQVAQPQPAQLPLQQPQLPPQMPVQQPQLPPQQQLALPQAQLPVPQQAQPQAVPPAPKQ